MGKGNPIEELLKENKLIIVDGAMATELEGKGCNLNDTLWSAKVLKENPSLIKEVHLDYYKAGADIGITASYQATLEGYKAKGLSETEAKDLIKSSVRLAKAARDLFWEEEQKKVGDSMEKRSKPLVAASIGPYGAYLADGSEYRGDYGVTIEFLKEFHRERIMLLLEEGVDLLACETLPCLDEAKAIIEILSEVPEVYAWFSFSCKDESHISDGTELSVCGEYLSQFSQVVAIGLNCTAPDYVDSLIRILKKTTKKPIIIYPNSGEHYDPIHKVWNSGAPGTAYRDRVKVWYESGARLIGGCCRTKPSDIAALSDWARKL